MNVRFLMMVCMALQLMCFFRPSKKGSRLGKEHSSENASLCILALKLLIFTTTFFEVLPGESLCSKLSFQTD